MSRLKAMLLGGPRNPFDPRIHHRLALVAFFAWVGLGSDGLSSSCYGPEEIFRQLEGHRHLALYLAGAIIVTVFLISASYRQIIEQFPTGGGGYLVATRLLGPVPGVISGAALVVDYVLTIAISVAAGGDAIFSFLPMEWQRVKVPAELGVVAWLILLNLRGVRESVLVLTPIFLAFIVSHVGLVAWGILRHAGDLGPMVLDTTRETHQALTQVGWAGVGIILLRAFALGGGTFTGIEAVSNGVGILREPKVENGKRTMLYMACSLAFTAGGILVGYLLNDVHFREGMTLNASLWLDLTSGWRIGSFETGPAIVVFTLLSEGALLFVAAQTGFVDGPRILAAMAVDEWVPKRFKLLSERLVTQNGVLSMGIAAAVVLAGTRGSVGLLVVMYSINVFLTFTLSQLGMARHWIAVRRSAGRWKRRLAVTAAGALVTATILIVTVTLKFGEGGWVTLVATAAFVAACFAIRSHYARVRRHMRTLDDTLLQLPLPDPKPDLELSEQGPTAIVLVERYDGLGVHTLLSIQRLFPGMFRNMVFVSVGLVDSAQFKGVESMEALEAQIACDLGRYVETAQRLGLYAEYRLALGTDLVQELEGVCVDVAREFRRPVVFAGQLVFEREDLLTRTLHHQTVYSIQRRLEFAGIQMIILPIRVWGTAGAA
ncbi:MAG TPA: APC family permease [Candidatus Eisenbacteria bacterium]|nr:APC family permease [Candidatus Eisenbacteria bacterium]